MMIRKLDIRSHQEKGHVGRASSRVALTDLSQDVPQGWDRRVRDGCRTRRGALTAHSRIGRSRDRQRAANSHHPGAFPWCRDSRAGAALHGAQYRSVDRLELPGRFRHRFHGHFGHAYAQKDRRGAGAALDNEPHDVHAGHLHRARSSRPGGHLLPRLN